MNVKELLKGLREGKVWAASRLISIVENDLPGAEEVMEEISGLIGHALRVGVTGPPGVGKSTLVDWMAGIWRQRGKTVGIVAVDPSSPFSGGALLGDRVRMRKVAQDPGVFVRSMASRGYLGGLSEAAVDAADILDAMGKDVVITETVGVGQSEVDIARVCDVCVLVLSPESGDSVQTLKAGLMEIADVYCVNKADRDGADRLVREIRFLLEMRGEEAEKPVLMTEALNGVGVEKVVDEVERMWGRGSRRREEMAKRKLEAAIKSEVERRIEGLGEEVERLTADIARGRISARKAARLLLRKLSEARKDE